MADIQRELDKIKAAVYGGEVRNAIHDGIKKINDAVEEVETEMSEWTQGNLDTTLKSDILPPKSSVVGGKIASLENVVADKESFMSTVEVPAANVITKTKSVTTAPKTYSNIRRALTGVKTDGYIWNAATNAPIAKTGGSFTKFEGISSYTIIYVSGYHVNDAAQPVATFYDSSEQFVSQVNLNFIESCVMGLQVVIPAGASYVMVNGMSDSIMNVTPAVYALIGTDDKVGSMQTLSGVLYSGKAWNINGSETVGADFQYVKYPRVPNASKVYVSGVSYGSGYRLVAFYDANGTLLSSFVNSGSTFCYRQEITVPANADYFIVNGSVAANFMPEVEYPVAVGEAAPVRSLAADINPYYLFIGDSYGEGYSHDGNNEGWISYLVGYIGLGVNEYASHYHGGDGFANGGFNNQINGIVNGDVTDVVICGGYNDSMSTETQILNGIQTCVNTAKSKWAGVKVHIGFVGHNKAGNGDGAEANWQTIRSGMLNVAMPAYKKCVSVGAEYMSGVETWLRDDDMTPSDGYHPSAIGNSKIAMAVANALKTGSAGDGVGVEKEIGGLRSAVDELDTTVNGGSILVPEAKTLSDCVTQNYYIDENSGVYIEGNNRGRYLPLNEAKKVSITANDTYGTQYAFLVNATCSAGATAPIVGGTLPISLSAGQSITETDVPTGATYLYFRSINSNGYSMFPSSILLYAQESSGGLVSRISTMDTATEGDIGKALIPKTVIDGKVVEWEFRDLGTVDNALDDASENPVRNSAITSAINTLDETLYGVGTLTPVVKTVSDFTTKDYYIGSDGKWNARSRRGYFIDITSNIKKISITGKETYGTEYAFLSSDNCIAGQSAAIVGSSTPTTVASGVTSEVDVPSGAEYLYIRNVNGDGYPMFPSSLIFYVYSSGGDGLVDRVETLEEATTAVKEFINNFLPKTVLDVNDFHVGTLYVSGTSINESASTYRVCNSSSNKIQLNAGDIIALSDYSHFKYMLFYSADGTAWTQGSWATYATTITNSGYYCVLIEDTTHTAQSSATALFNLLTYTGTSWVEKTENELSELKSGQTNPKFSHLSFDDVRYCMEDITANANTYTSIFDNDFFAMLKDLHDTYGTVVSLYLFITNSGSGIAGYTTKFAGEFAKNADWLKFGLHQGGTNYENTTAQQAKNDYDTFTENIVNIAGSVDVIDRCPRLGNFAGNSESMIAMRDADAGIVGLLSAYDSRDSYYLSSTDSAYVFEHGRLYDTVNRLVFFRSLKAMEAIAPSSILPQLRTLSGTNGSDYAILMMHEYGVYDSTYSIISSMVERLEYACNWVKSNGYVWDFPMNRILR